MSQEQNPYAAPQYDGPLLVSPDETEAERVRRAHLSHETSLRSWGMIYLIAGGYCLVGAVGGLIATAVALVTTRLGNWDVLSTAGIGAFYGVLSAVLLPIGLGLRRLNPRIKLPATIVSVLGLILFPCGTVVNVYVLYLLLCRKGQKILSADYADIRLRTPHIVYRAPRSSWIAVSLAVAVAAVLLALAALHTRF